MDLEVVLSQKQSQLGSGFEGGEVLDGLVLLSLVVEVVGVEVLEGRVGRVSFEGELGEVVGERYA